MSTVAPQSVKYFTKDYWLTPGSYPSINNTGSIRTNSNNIKPKRKQKLFKGISLGKRRHAIPSVITVGLMATVLTEIVSAFTSIVNSRSLVKHAEKQDDYVQAARARQAQSSEIQRLISWSGDLALGLLGMFILGPWGAALAATIAYKTTNSLLPPKEKIAVLRSNNSPSSHQPESETPPHEPEKQQAPPQQPTPKASNPPPSPPVMPANTGAGLSNAPTPLGDSQPKQAQQPVPINIYVQGGQGGQSTVSDIANDVTGAK